MDNLTLIATNTTTAAVITGLAGWLGKVWADRIARIESGKLDAGLADLRMEKEHLLEKISLYTRRYSDSQFIHYNELWVSLIDLKKAADDLWESLSKKRVQNFAVQLKATAETIEKSALLIEDQDYIELGRVIDGFERFELGKWKLSEIRARPDLHYNDDEARSAVSANRELKRSYTDLLDGLRIRFKNQISGAGISGT